MQAGFVFDAFLELAQESANDVPAVGAAEFDVALTVDADDALVGHAEFGEFAGVQFVVAERPAATPCPTIR